MMIWLRRAVSWTVRTLHFVMTTERQRLASLTVRGVLLLPFTLTMWMLSGIIWVASSNNTLPCYLIPGYGLFCWLVVLQIRVMVWWFNCPVGFFVSFVAFSVIEFLCMYIYRVCLTT
jgi:hypothetical protein